MPILLDHQISYLYSRENFILLIDVEALPDDLQRDISQMREIDLIYQGNGLALLLLYQMVVCKSIGAPPPWGQPLHIEIKDRLILSLILFASVPFLLHYYFADKLREISRLIDVYNERKEGPLRKRALIQIQRCLVKSQELGDEKLQHVSQMIDMVSIR